MVGKIVSLVLILALSFAGVASAQTYTPGEEIQEQAICDISLNNGDGGDFSIGEIIAFDGDVAINGIYDAKDELVQDEYNVQIKKDEIWDTSSLATGLYIAYNNKAYSWIMLTPFIPSDANISFTTARQATIGDNILIDGKTNIDASLSVVLTSEYDKWDITDAVIVDEGKFSAKIDTSNLSQGTYKLMVFYDGGNDGYQPSDIHSISTLILVMPKIVLNTISESTSTDSHIEVSGTATGTKEIEIWIVGNGVAGLTTTPAKGQFDASFDIDSVEYWFTQQGMVNAPVELKRGEYAVLVVNPGTDGAFRYKGSLERTGMLLAMPDGANRFLTNMEMSDNLDLISVSIVSIDLPRIELADAVIKGNDVMISGRTNLADGTLIIITTQRGIYYTEALNNSFSMLIEGLGEGDHRIEVCDDMNTAYDTRTFTVSSSVDIPPVIDIEEHAEEEDKETSGGIPIWIYVILGVVIVGGLAFIFLKKKE